MRPGDAAATRRWSLKKVPRIFRLPRNSACVQVFNEDRRLPPGLLFDILPIQPTRLLATVSPRRPYAEDGPRKLTIPGQELTSP